LGMWKILILSASPPPPVVQILRLPLFILIIPYSFWWQNLPYW
jgi:hypothetical protein